jgi:RNA polymerase sigma-70 factor (sigma-E family)
VIALSASEDPPTSGRRIESLNDFAGRCGLELLRFAYLVAGDRQRAEDLLQEALLGMHRRFGDQALPLDNPVGYARRAIVHANVSWARRAVNREVLLELVPDTAAVAAVDPAERDALWQALRRLPVRQRTVLVLRFYADAGDDDIAEALGCRRGTVRSLASRALAALRCDPTVVEGGAR